MKKSSPVVHFEMGYKDGERMRKFYETVFGWETKQMGSEMGNYILANTTEADENGRPKAPGAINGGFYKKSDSPLSHAPSVVIAVDDINKAMDAVKKNGGKILGAMTADRKSSMEPQMIPGVGLWISAMDTEENRFSILQPMGM